MITPVRLNGRDVKPHKALADPQFDTRTVLTNSPWEFVSLWLKREKKDSALFYWNQAREFAQASSGLPVQSSPLLLYYTFMNATKALLLAKGITFNEGHGIRAHNMRGASSKIVLSNEGVRILNGGVLPSLSGYLGETETRTTHSLQDIFYNLPFIHRTYTLTYKTTLELYIPLTNCRYSYDSLSGQIFLQANLSQDYTERKYIRRLPPTLIPDPSGADIRAIRSTAFMPATGPTLSTAAHLQSIAVLNRQIRQDIHYINGIQTLWYARSVVPGSRQLSRFSTTLILAAMHRLSEICRYRPIELASFLTGQGNWLLSEFIRMSPGQFLDEIASEITGYQFMIPNVRAAT